MNDISESDVNNMSTNFQMEMWEKKQQEELYTATHGAECPYCHSRKTEKISTLSKAVHTALFGLFSISRNSKQWHCNHCKSDF